MISKSDESEISDRYLISKKLSFSFLGFLLILSVFFVFLHGEYVVSDGYIEYSKVLFHEIFSGPEPTLIEYQRSVYAYTRPLYPLVVSITAFFVTWGNLGLAGHLISAISGIIGLICFNKLLDNQNIEPNKRKFLVLIMASSPAFTVYWVKFAPEMMFLMFCFLGVYFYMQPKNNILEKSSLFYLIFLCLSFLTRESGLLLVIMPIFSKIIKIEHKRRRIWIAISAIIGLFFITFIGFILFLKPDYQSVSWANFFDTYVWVGYLSNGNINPADIRIEYVPEFIHVLFRRYLDFNVLINLIGAFLVFGSILAVILVFYNWKGIFNQLIEDPIALWSVYYFFIIWFIMLSTFNERYTLILLLPILLLYSKIFENHQMIPQKHTGFIDPRLIILLLHIFVLSVRFILLLF